MATPASADQPSLGQRFKAEMREYVFISFYLWVCFAILFVYRASLVDTAEFDMLPLGLAAVKALILGKFLLIGKAVKVGSKLTPGRLWGRILWKSIALLLALLVFTAIEELVMGLVHGQSVAHTIEEFIARPLAKSVAPALVMLLVLIPMIAFEEIDHELGTGSLKRMLFSRAEPAPGSD